VEGVRGGFTGAECCEGGGASLWGTESALRAAESRVEDRGSRVEGDESALRVQADRRATGRRRRGEPLPPGVRREV
jgi:hypothetical protein